MEYLQVTTVGRTRIVPIGGPSARRSSAKSGGRRFFGGMSPVRSPERPSWTETHVLLVAIRVKEIPLLAYQFSDAVFEYPLPK